MVAVVVLVLIIALGLLLGLDGSLDPSCVPGPPGSSWWLSGPSGLAL